MNIKIKVTKAALLLTVLFTSIPAVNDFCPDIPLKGYGLKGSFPVKVDSVRHPQLKYLNIYSFVPVTTEKEKFPLVFFCPGMDARNYENYKELLITIASNGYVVIFSPYQKAKRKLLQTIQSRLLNSNFKYAVESFITAIDTTKIGIIGHSFGGGVVPSLTWRAINENKWGLQRATMFIMSPWYMHDICDEMIENFPEHVKMIVQTFDHDQYNDQRIAIDIFHSFQFPDSNKEYIEVRSDKLLACNLLADHFLPTQKSSGSVLQINGVFRPLCAMLDYTLKNDTNARVFAFGHGNEKQTSMGFWNNGVEVKKLLITNNPEPRYPQNHYFYFWENRANPRYIFITNNNLKIENWRLPYRFRTFKNYIEAGQYYFKDGRHESNEAKKSTGPIPPIGTGYGSPGPYGIIKDSIINPAWLLKPVYVFFPVNKGKGLNNSDKYPVALFAHGYSKSEPDIYKLIIENIVSHGIICLFVPYRTLPGWPGRPDDYEILFKGFELGMQKYSSFIDSSKIGVIGHSFGGGATPWITWKAINEKNWGKNSAFMFIMAPWYVRNITVDQLHSFPSHVNMIVEVYHDDAVNDLRIAADLFNRISIPDSNKNFLTIYSDSGAGYLFKADHSLPKSGWAFEGTEDGYDYYGVLKPLDALIDYTFNKNPEGKKCALTGGVNPCQTFMGIYPNGKPVKKLSASFHAAIDSDIENKFIFNWNNPLNPFRKEKNRGD